MSNQPATEPEIFLRTVLGRKFAPDCGYRYNAYEIASALAKLPRFGCQSRVPYSVAQHSVVCAEHVTGRAFVFEALMHDAHEGMMGIDIPRPWKLKWPVLKEIERVFSDDLRRNFGLPLDMSGPVVEVDNRALVTEAAAHMTLFDADVPELREVRPLEFCSVEPWAWTTRATAG